MPDIQPSLPEHAEPETIEYFPKGDDDVPWTVLDWRGLHEAFNLSRSEVVRWHITLADCGRPWKVVRRIFRVMACMGDACEDEDQEEWDWKSLSAHVGVPEKELRADLDAAVEFWRKRRVADKIAKSEESAPPAPAFGPVQQMDEAAISELLRRYRFDRVRGDDRTFVAGRITEMRDVFDDVNRRESARQLLIMEMNLADGERTRELHKQRLETLLKKSSNGAELDKNDSAEVIRLQEALEKNEKSHAGLFEKYSKLASALGAEEIEQGELRKVALGTASHLVEAHRQYYVDGERDLIDGVFTAEELIWLTTPIPLRPAQYRLDWVLRVREAMMPENLFAPDYRPTPIQREASRRMLKLGKMLCEEEEQEFIRDIDEVSTEEDHETAPEMDDSPPPDLPVEEHPPAPPPPAASMVIA